MNWVKLNAGIMQWSPTLDMTYLIVKMVRPCLNKNGQNDSVVTYEVTKVANDGLLFMYACDTFAECKSWVQADFDIRT